MHGAGGRSHQERGVGIAVQRGRLRRHHGFAVVIVKDGVVLGLAINCKGLVAREHAPLGLRLEIGVHLVGGGAAAHGPGGEIAEAVERAQGHVAREVGSVVAVELPGDGAAGGVVQEQALERGAVVERAHADARHRGGQHDFVGKAAAVERVVADAGDTAAEGILAAAVALYLIILAACACAPAVCRHTCSPMVSR